LQALTAEAAEVLRQVMNDPLQQGSNRVGVARTVLDFAAKFGEAEDLSARLDALEKGAK
jgi:hypothetical protein